MVVLVNNWRFQKHRSFLEIWNENLEMIKTQLKSDQNSLNLSKMSKFDVNCVNSSRLLHKKQGKKSSVKVT